LARAALEVGVNEKAAHQAHPNSHFIVAAKQCASIAPELANPKGVLSATSSRTQRRPETVSVSS
jgi:GTP-dependent phosphoenolpyruvate carboxykinase